MAAPLRVAVIGACGRLGRRACGWIEAAPDLELGAQLTSRDALEPGLAGCAVALELTRAGLGFEHARRALEAGLCAVVGTSGVDADQAAELGRLAQARGLGVCVVPNFSLGAALAQRLACLAAEHLPEVAIAERHHAGKLDAISGTALATAHALAAVLGRDPASIPIAAERLADAPAEQTVTLASPGEQLAIQHRVHDPEAYRPGLLASLRRAAEVRGLVLGLAAVLGLEPA